MADPARFTPNVAAVTLSTNLFRPTLCQPRLVRPLVRTDAASIHNLARKLATLAQTEVSQVQCAVSDKASLPAAASDACFAIAPVILEKAIITNKTTPGDIAARLATAAVKEYEALLQQSRDPKELLLQAMTLNRNGFLGQYSRNKAVLERAWNFSRDQEADPFESMGMIAFTYCRHLAKGLPEAPEAIAAMQSALGAFVTTIHEAIQEA
jgi:hypothetical protein